MFNPKCNLSHEKKYCYVKWIAKTCDHLITLIDPDSRLISQVSIFNKPDSPSTRHTVHQLAKHHPDEYRSSIRSILEAYSGPGLILTQDWYFPFRMIVEEAKGLGIKTILVPHEGVFSDVDKYYTDREYGFNHPICDLSLIWGELQKRTFETRGHGGNTLKIVGSPKIYEAQSSGIKPTPAPHRILFALQNMDCQQDHTLAVGTQTELVREACKIALSLNITLTLRNPPNNVDMIPEDIHELAIQSPHVIIIENQSSPVKAINDNSVIISVNSTMLLEALILGRASFALAGEGLQQIWQKYGIPSLTLTRIKTLLEDNKTLPPATPSPLLIKDFGLDQEKPIERINSILLKESR